MQLLNGAIVFLYTVETLRVYILISGGSISLPAVAGCGSGCSLILAVTVQCACDRESVWG